MELIVAVEFTRGWWGTGLADYRGCGGTYQAYPEDDVPALSDELFDGTFPWLTPKAAGPDAFYMTDDVPRDRLDAVARRLADAGLSLPRPFVTFMADERSRHAVPSCTSCYWDLVEEPVPSPIEPDARLVRFLNDQQGCLFWSLYLRPGGESFVVCTTHPHDPPGDDPDERIGPAEMLADTLWVAPDFERFIYRFWLENVVWFHTVWNRREIADLPERVRRYLAHYQAVASGESGA
jgi:hypothetical protein